MLHRKGAKKDSYFMPYFWMYTTVLVYFLFSSCFGARKDLMPLRNQTVDNMSPDDVKHYSELLGKLSPKGKVQLEHKIKTINDPTDRTAFLKQTNVNHVVFYHLCKLFPKDQRITFEQKFDMIPDIHDQEELIHQISTKFKVIQDVDPLTKRHYIDLMEILPDNEATALKNQIVELTNQVEVNQLIVSKLPNAFKQLVNSDKKADIDALSDYRRQEFIKQLIHVSMGEKKEDTPASKESQPNNGDAIPSDTQLDSHKLLEQANKAQQQQEEDIPKDEWGAKLPLKDDKKSRQRSLFFIYIAHLALDSHKYLKEFFDQADSGSLKNFFSVFFTGFDQNDAIELLRTLITLYRADKDLALKLCNRPKSLGTFEKISIARLIGFGQRLDLLKRLDNLLKKPKS